MLKSTWRVARLRSALSVRSLLALSVAVVAIAGIPTMVSGLLSAPASHGAQFTSGLPSTRSVPAGGGAGNSSPSTWFPTPIRHVFTIVLENAEWNYVFQVAPFLAHLAHVYSYASNYYAVCHPSAPNYLALTSGDPFTQCGSDTYNVYDTLNIGDLADSAGRSWDLFHESMPAPCVNYDKNITEGGPNAFLYYSDIVSNASRCIAHDLPFTAFQADVVSGLLPNYALLIPNSTDQGHEPSTTAYASQWLQGFLSPLLNDSFFQSSVFFITFDEGVNDKSGYTSGGTTVAGGHTYTVAVSPYTRGVETYPSHNYTALSSHYNLLTTTEWLLGIREGTGHHDNWTYFPPMKGLFDFSGWIRLSVSPGADPSAGPAPLTSEFTAAPAGGTPPYAFVWRFGDGASSTLQNPSHTYTATGNYTATVTVTDAHGTKASAEVAVVVGRTVRGLTLDPSASPAFGPAPLTVNFTGNVTGQSPPFEYSWNFSGLGTSSLENPGWTFTSTGEFNVTFTVKDSTGATSSRTLAIEVGPFSEPLSAFAFASTVAGSAPLSVNFTGYLEGGMPPYHSLWSFGDGSSSPGPNASHSYTAAGTYNATLEGSDSNGTVATSNLTIAVFPELLVSLSPDQSSGPAPLAVSFTARVAGGSGGYNLVWNFGDNTSSLGGASFNHTYPSPGSYVASLWVQDSVGDNTTATAAITVLPWVAIEIVGGSNPPVSGSPVTLELVAPQNESPSQVNWTVNGVHIGADSTTIIWMPSAPGSYVIGVTALTSTGRPVADQMTLTVVPPPTLVNYGGLVVTVASAAAVGAVLFLAARRNSPPRAGKRR
jgi:PKD repeat protein